MNISQKGRFDETIYGVEPRVRTDAAGRPEKERRLRIREVLTKGGWPVNDAEQWLAAAAKRWTFFEKYFPEHKWRAWLAENTRRQQENARIKKANNGESPLDPLPLASSVSNAPMQALTVDASKPEFFDAHTLVPHETYGAKNPAERNMALTLYAYKDDKGREKIISRAVLHPRLVAAQDRWRELGVAVPPTEALPDGARRIGRVAKGDLLCLPLRRDGEAAATMDEAYRRVWYQVTALKSGGQIEMKPAEFNAKELKLSEQGVVEREGSRLFGLRIKPVFKAQNESLLNVLRLNHRLRPM